MKKVLRIDANGLFVEDVILQDNEDVPTDCIETPCPDGFYHPRWDGAQWVEGGTAPLETPEQEIERLKAELGETDYKIIKCSEYSLLGLELPYDISSLHSSRQALRDRINVLESGLSML
jgi:hypothetical protein